MTEHNPKQLGKTLWNIADQLRGAMNADDLRDYILSFLFLRYLSGNYEKAAKKELGSDYPKQDNGSTLPPLAAWYEENPSEVAVFEKQMRCKAQYGANLVARTYPIAFVISSMAWVNNHAHVLRFADPAPQKFVELYLNSINFQDFITGIAQPILNRAMLDCIPTPIPEREERKKIANCLSSLDTLIAAESEKLEALKAHKQGLMQQLFPSLERDSGK